MIVCKKNEAKKLSIAPGVTNHILINGEKIMLVLIEFEPGSVVPLHSHPHEQAGMCLKGKVEFQGEDKTSIVDSDMVYLFHSNEKHGAKTVSKEGAVVLEVFSPPREDFLIKVK
jgi:quercetin dioxygenase-like cupin family protein